MTTTTPDSKDRDLLMATLAYNLAFAAAQIALYLRLGVGAFWGTLFTGLYLLGVNALWQLLFLTITLARLSGRGFFNAAAAFLKDRRKTIDADKIRLPEVAKSTLRGTAWPLLLVPAFFTALVILLDAFTAKDYLAIKTVALTQLAGGCLGFLLARRFKIAPIPLGFGDGYDA